MQSGRANRPSAIVQEFAAGRSMGRRGERAGGWCGLRISAALLPMLVVVIACAGAATARADVAALVEEPFGHYDQSGHVAVYLDRVCAETPTRLRRCRAGERGVVLARYHHISDTDWLAVPLIPYLYAVDSVADVPATMDAPLEARLREAWRSEHLDEIAPRGAHRDWVQLIGGSYDRKMIGFELKTSEEQDDAFIAAFNARPNDNHYNLLLHNCADFVGVILNFYFPGAVRWNRVTEFGIATPRQVARSVERYGKLHPELDEFTVIIPQVPGTLARSHRVESVAEAMVRTKKYVIPMTIACPPLTAVMAVLWLSDGRYELPATAPAMAELAR